MLHTELPLLVVQIIQVVATLAHYSCPPDWKLNGISCYKLFDWSLRKNWTDAETNCSHQTGHLVSITTAEENTFVMSLSSENVRFWIGIHEPTTENNRMWSDGNTVNFTAWRSGEPNRGNNLQDCVLMNRTSGEWFDVRCSQRRRYVCEIDATFEMPTNISATTNTTTVGSQPSVTTQIETTTTSFTIHTTRESNTGATLVSTNTSTGTGVTHSPAVNTVTASYSSSFARSTASAVRSLPTDKTENTQTLTATEETSISSFVDTTKVPSSTGTISTYIQKSSNGPHEVASNSSNGNTLYIGIGAAGGVCVILAVSVFAICCYCRRKYDVSNDTKHKDGETIANPLYQGRDLKSVNEQQCTDVRTDQNHYDYSVTKFEVNTAPHKDATRSSLTVEDKSTCHQNGSIRDTGNRFNDNFNGNKSRFVGCLDDDKYLCSPLESRLRKSSETMQDVSSNLELAFDKLKADIYWQPAATEEQLYSQIERYNFRQITRKEIDSREYVASGEFGTVEKALWTPAHIQDTSVTVAVKTLKSESKEDHVRFLQEAALLGQFCHRNVVSLFGVVTVGSPLMIILEYMANGDLKQYLVEQRTTALDSMGEQSSCLEDMLLRMCRDIASGLDYLSGKSFIHRDLAARNVLLDHEYTCKIGDFGLSRDLADETYYVTRGGKLPIRWSAPETLNYKKYSVASDIWSFGIVLYEIWSLGCRPYGQTSNQDVISMTDEGYRLPPPPGCSRSLYQLMIDCWHPDHHRRPTSSDVVKRLSQSSQQLIKNTSNEEAIAGRVGAEPTLSVNSYQDLQVTYLSK